MILKLKKKMQQKKQIRQLLKPKLCYWNKPKLKENKKEFKSKEA